MLRYFTFSRPLSGFSSHFCNTHFRDTWFSSLPLFSNYSTGFRICESSKYHSKQFFYSSFTLFSKIRKLTVFSRNPRTLIIPQSVRLRMDADGSFVPKNRLSCRCPAARPVRPAHPARNFPETKKIICPSHAAHVGHMMGVWFNLSPVNSFHRCVNSFHRCVNSFHRCGGPPPSRREVFGEGKRKLAEYRRARDARPYNVAEIATVRCVCNAGLHHCNRQLHRRPP